MEYRIMPRVKRADFTGETFRFEALKVFCIGDETAFSRTLTALLPDLNVSPAGCGEANVTLSVAPVFSSQSEYCAIRILPDRMEICCRDEAGARNAATILAQLLFRTRTALPCGTIVDWPDTAYRAMMLESSGRCWIPMEKLRFYIRKMALARMNVLQFHFMESPGCTIALDCYPDLHGYGPENLKYSKREIREMIAYAAELGITVTPFVEVISHSTAFNKAADIGCPGDAEPAMFAVCVGQEKTYAAIEKVLAEVAELFPDPVIHIGGDEYDMSAVSPRTVHWAECPHCRALSAKMGFTTYRELFIYAVERVNTMVNKLGKVAMIWNADLKPGALPREMPRNIVIHYYRGDNTLCKEKIFGLSMDGYIEDGFSVLNSSYKQTYLDNYVAPERLGSWNYHRDPAVSRKNRAGLIGGCCCAWDNSRHFDRTIAPGIVLFADRLCNGDEDPVVYDEAYARALTQVLFEDQLPAGMNVFAAVGDVLPPLDLKQDTLFYERKMAAPLAELEEIQRALLACRGSFLANAYAEIAAAAIEYSKKNTAPLTETVEFEG